MLNHHTGRGYIVKWLSITSNTVLKAQDVTLCISYLQKKIMLKNMNTNFMNNVIKHSFNGQAKMFNQNEEIIGLTLY
jgi:hypothetical protein